MVLCLPLWAVGVRGRGQFLPAAEWFTCSLSANSDSVFKKPDTTMTRHQIVSSSLCATQSSRDSTPTLSDKHFRVCVIGFSQV